MQLHSACRSLSTSVMTQALVRYRILLPDGEARAFTVDVGPSGVGLPRERPIPRPAWTELTYHQCPHCPLDPAESPHCPAAVGLAELVEAIGDLYSFERVNVEVTAGSRRTEFDDVELQNVLGSLLGVLMPMSGCPHTAFFRPMARFHLPLSSIEETVFRSTGSFLLGEWLRRSQGADVSFDLDRLRQLYQRVQVVNQHLHARLQDATTTDSSLNAVALLDALAQILPMEVDASLRSLHPLFEAFLDEGLAEPVAGDTAGDGGGVQDRVDEAVARALRSGDQGDAPDAKPQPAASAPSGAEPETGPVADSAPDEDDPLARALAAARKAEAEATTAVNEAQAVVDAAIAEALRMVEAAKEAEPPDSPER